MKKILGLLTVATFFAACDNGDMTFESLNFDETNIQKCEENALYFKAKGNELLLVDFTYNNGTMDPNSSVLDALELDRDYQLPTTNTNKIYYRTYDGNINASTICSVLAPANPKVTSEYTSVNGGTIWVRRSIVPVVKSNATTNSSESVNVNYSYTIKFENITLTNGSSDIKYATYNYGTYVYETALLSFNFTSTDLCDNNVLGMNNAKEMLQIHLPEDFAFPQTATKQTINLNSENSLHYFRKKDSTPTFANACEEINEEEIAEDWTATSGSLSIESRLRANSTTQYEHIVRIVNARFSKPSGEFVLTNKIIGTYVTNNQ